MEYSELLKKMREFNLKHKIERAACVAKNASGETVRMRGHVVLSERALNPKFAPYSAESRTYSFDNYEKALTPGDGGYSIFAWCEADQDSMRIESLPDSMVEDAEIDEIVE